MKPVPGTCTLPPPGWYCTLAAGHEGPCPTVPVVDEAAVHIEELAAGFMREAAAELARQDEARVRELARGEVLRFGRLLTYELSGYSEQTETLRAVRQAQARFAAGDDL